MSVRFNCQSCGAVVKAPDAAVGRKASCPECGKKMVVPAPARKPAAKSDDIYEVEEVGEVTARSSVHGPEHSQVSLPTGPMLHIRFECPTCMSIIKAPRTVAGKKSNCPNCGDRVRIPVPLDDDDSPIEIIESGEPRALELRTEVAADAPAPSMAGHPDRPASHLRFDCPHCRSSIKAPLATAGKKSNCPNCGERVRIPEAKKDSVDDDVFDVDVSERAGAAPLTFDEKQVNRSGLRSDSEMIRFECPYCDALIKAPASVAGKKSTCPACGKRVRVPVGDPNAAPSGEIAIVEATARRRPASNSDWNPSEDPRLSSTAAGKNTKLPIRFQCPHCEMIIKCPPQYEGKKSTCPNCQERIRIPMAPSVDEPQPIEMLEMSPEEERRIQENLSRQTRGSSISGILILSDTSDDGRRITSDVNNRDPLKSRENIKPAEKPQPKVEKSGPTRSGKNAVQRSGKTGKPPPGRPKG